MIVASTEPFRSMDSCSLWHRHATDPPARLVYEPRRRFAEAIDDEGMAGIAVGPR